MSNPFRTNHRKRVRRLLRRQGNVCGICGKSLESRLATVDHVIPKAKGGTLGWGNILVTHRSCNEAKADRDPTSEEITLARRVGANPS